MRHGVFLVSLDFELYWGVRDKRSIEDYGPNIKGGLEAVPRILDVFEAQAIRGTWATVGLLYFDSREAALARAPSPKPNYQDANLCAYRYLERNTNLDKSIHFAPGMVDRLAKMSSQEVATHTFSHYYCLEKGQRRDAFEADIAACIAIAKEHGVSTETIVFPRNQWNPDYLPGLAEMGIRSYRGNEASWLFRATESNGQGMLMRMGRFLDSFINLSGHHTYALSDCGSAAPYNFPSSRFLRPYNRGLAFLDSIRLRRIKAAMRYAAKRNEIFHLWWHPHNFGKNLERNIKFLLSILDEFKALEKRHGMKSMTMAELAAIADANEQRA